MKEVIDLIQWILGSFWHCVGAILLLKAFCIFRFNFNFSLSKEFSDLIKEIRQELKEKENKS